MLENPTKADATLALYEHSRQSNTRDTLLGFRRVGTAIISFQEVQHTRFSGLSGVLSSKAHRFTSSMATMVNLRAVTNHQDRPKCFLLSQ